MSTFDWNKHWEVTSEGEEARKFAIKMADMISAFVQKKRIGLVADYGCGPATLLFSLAERFPQTEFYGFDTAASIIRKDSEKALQLGLRNLHFERDGLPSPRKERTYDLVVCFATLHYIKEIERAVKDLFELVNPKGYLIFNYPNIYSRVAYRKSIKPEDEPMKKRFALVLAGENLLSLKKISIVLGARPKKFYSSIKANIYVLARAPTDPRSLLMLDNS
jgi:trans-aconitate methyltransferase